MRFKRTSDSRRIFFANIAERKKKRIEKHLRLGVNIFISNIVFILIDIIIKIKIFFHYLYLQKQAKDKLVYTLRNYKEGELPDIQIKYKEIIQPLQALAISDIDISKNLFIMILNSIWSKRDEIMVIHYIYINNSYLIF